MHTRWKESQRLLRPIIDALPQVLILAVILFVLGLLDSLLSSALALAPLSVPVLGAGIMATVFVGLSGITMAFTVVHGCTYPSESPFQTVLSTLLEGKQLAYWMHAPVSFIRKYVFATVSCLVSPVTDIKAYLHALLAVVLSPQEDNLEAHDIEVDQVANDAQPLSTQTLEIYRTALLLTHDDQSVESATAASWDIVRSVLTQKKPCAIFQFQNTVVVFLVYLLSPECSRRANLTAASIVIEEFGDVPNFVLSSAKSRNSWIMSDASRYTLAVALVRTATRDRVTLSNSTSQDALWTSVYMQALTSLLMPHWSENARKHAPCVLLLFVDDRAFGVEASSDRVLRLLSSVRCEALETFSQCNRDRYDRINLNERLSHLLRPLGVGSLCVTLIDPSAMATLIDYWLDLDSSKQDSRHEKQDSFRIELLGKLYYWLCENDCVVFIMEVLEPTRLIKLDWRQRSLVLDAVAQFRSPHYPWSFSDVDRVILHFMVHTVKYFVNDEYAHASLHDADIIVETLVNVAKRSKGLHILDPLDWNCVRTALRPLNSGPIMQASRLTHRMTEDDAWLKKAIISIRKVFQRFHITKTGTGACPIFSSFSPVF